MKRVLETPGLVKIAHNWPFDGPRLMRKGIDLQPPLWDTLLGEQVIDGDAPGYSLDEVASRNQDCHRWKHLGAPGLKPKAPKQKTWKRPFTCTKCGKDGFHIGTGVGPSPKRNLPDRRVCWVCSKLDYDLEMAKWREDEVQYNRTDASILPGIYYRQLSRLRSSKQLHVFTNMMNVLYHVLIPLQLRGVHIDAGARAEAASIYEEKVQANLLTWSKLSGGCNPSSVPQLKKLLYEEWGLPLQYKTVKQDGKRVRKVTTDEEALHNLIELSEARRPALETLLAYRNALKWKSTYIDIGDKIFPNYSPASKDTAEGMKRFSAIAATGRIIAKGGNNPDGSKCPPLQQIPEDLRALIVPRKGYVFVGADYSSQELRLIAYHSKCKKLIEQIEHGHDIHDENSTNFGIDRTRAKNLFYGTVYAASARALQHALAKEGYSVSREECAAFITYMEKTYPEIFEWHKVQRAFAESKGYVVNSFGRRRQIKDVDRMYNEVVNFPIQSDGADMQWNILIPTDRLAQEYAGYISILLHDGFYWEVPEGTEQHFMKRLRPLLEHKWEQVHPEFWCPVDMKTGHNWRDLH